MAEKKQYDNNGRISIWERVRKSDGAKFLSGNVEIDGVMYDILLNYNESSNPKAPKIIGKMTVAE